MEIVFWLSLAFVFYTYLVYPILLYFWSIFFPKKVEKEDIRFEPTVSVVIAARNEEKNIEQRIRNLIDQDYPIDKIEIIVVSDGSYDNTHGIVEQLASELNDRATGQDNFLRLLSYSPSRGKPFSINTGVAATNGEIVVFTDCRQRFSKDAVRHLVNNFNDEDVGCVSGELVFEETHGSSIQAEMGAYWRFEKWLRRLESKTGSVPGATGAIYAIRKKLFRPIPEQTLLDDVLIPLNIAIQGYRVIFDSEAVAFDTVSKDLSQEKRRKIRTLAGNWQLLIMQPNLMNPLKNPLWIKFLSHKIFRLLVPYCLIALLVTSICLRNLSSIFVLMAFALFFIIAFLPPLSGYFEIVSKLSRIFRSIIFLNYCALLSPIKLAISRKKLW
jgi:cellulose synthase/poly-beta-1,6-N-acetylglucosamine synthase-like glycosyltransferase